MLTSRAGADTQHPSTQAAGFEALRGTTPDDRIPLVNSNLQVLLGLSSKKQKVNLTVFGCAVQRRAPLCSERHMRIVSPHHHGEV